MVKTRTNYVVMPVFARRWTCTPGAHPRGGPAHALRVCDGDADTELSVTILAVYRTVINYSADGEDGDGQLGVGVAVADAVRRAQATSRMSARCRSISWPDHGHDDGSWLRVFTMGDAHS